MIYFKILINLYTDTVVRPFSFILLCLNVSVHVPMVTIKWVLLADYETEQQHVFMAKKGIKIPNKNELKNFQSAEKHLVAAAIT